MVTLQRTLSCAFACALMAAAAGCGGSSKKSVDEPGDREPAAAPAKDGGDVLIPPEKMDQIQRFFDRKRNYMTRCFTEAVEAGEVSQRANGRVTVTMTIDTRGRPTKVRATLVQPKSAYLESCVVENVSKWTITDLPKPLDYSYTFGFGLL